MTPTQPITTTVAWTFLARTMNPAPQPGQRERFYDLVARSPHPAERDALIARGLFLGYSLADALAEVNRRVLDRQWAL
jgi:hypothetical protein